jgi:hypothetical protein
MASHFAVRKCSLVDFELISEQVRSMNVSAAIRTDEHGPEESCGAAAWEDMVLETNGARL